MRTLLVSGTVLAVLLIAGPAPAQLFLDFEDLPVGSELRVPDPPTVSNGVPLDGEEFFWLPTGSTTAGVATVQSNGDAGGSGNEIWANNINLDFGLAKPLSSLDFLFGEYGGNLNVEINGQFRNFRDMQDIDLMTFGPATVSVTDLTGGATGQGTGRVDVTGIINSFLIGGQEFAIDDVNGAKLDGGNGARWFTFESVPLGTQYGSPPPNVPGEVVLTEDDIDMSVENFSTGAFNFAEIIAPPDPFAPNTTQALATNNINVKFDLTQLGFDVKYAQLEYVDLAVGAGMDNFELNTTGLQVVGTPADIVCPVGFQCSVTQYSIAGGVKGRIAITADPGNVIDTILIGGQELAIDNFHVAVPEPSGLLLVTMTLCSLAVFRQRRCQLRP